MRIILIIKEVIMHDHANKFREFLLGKGLKLTEPRQLILDAAFEVHEHFDAEQLYDRIKLVSNDISLATVYRTLPLLIEAGLIQRSGRNAFRDTYEHIYGHPRHVHWICDRCHSVTETDVKDLLPAISKVSSKLSFQLTEPKLNFHGICWKCQSLENENQ